MLPGEGTCQGQDFFFLFDYVGTICPIPDSGSLWYRDLEDKFIYFVRTELGICRGNTECGLCSFSLFVVKVNKFVCS